MDKKRILMIIAWLFAVLWVYASVTKLSDFGTTLHSMQKQPLPQWSKAALSWLLPVLELLLALLLVPDQTRTTSLYLSTLLMLAFTLYVLYALGLPKKNIPCSCGGIISRLGWKGHLWFNLFWVFLGTTAVVLNTYNRKATRQMP